jgi:ATP-dependent Lon protease
MAQAPEYRPPLREQTFICPVLPARDMVMYPHMIIPLFVGRPVSMQAVEAASGVDKVMIVLAQRDVEIEDPRPDDLFTVGTEISVGHTWRMPDGTISVLAQGRRRLRIVRYTQSEPYLAAEVAPLGELPGDAAVAEPLRREALALFEQCVELSPDLRDDAFVSVMNVQEPGLLADLMASMMQFRVDQKQTLLETLDPYSRLRQVSTYLGQELDILELQDEIHLQVQEEVDRSQREYYLREQMRVIQSELGEIDLLGQELHDLRQRIATAHMPEHVAAKAEREIERLESMPPLAPETGIIRTYLDWLIDLPWRAGDAESTDIPAATEILEAEHYGLRSAKERILEQIAVRKLAPLKMRSPILCFVGPPGTGKTSLGRSIAAALGREFVRVSLGGIRDEAEIRGHRRTYIGAMPGRIIQTMRRAGTTNPVFMLDEIDKLGMDFRGDPSAALLEVLDPEQNHAFSDHYLDVDYDLSRVLFIATANWVDPIPPALLDRMEVIEFPGYIEEEKLEIARQFLVPRQLESHGLQPDGVKFSTPALRGIIREYTHEAGVRNLEREIATICRKVARRVAEARRAPKQVHTTSLARYLGPPRFTYGMAEEHDEIGVATGVAVTEAGGDLLSIEVTLMPGKGNLSLTGQLGEVMQESAQAALSYARANARALGIRVKDFDQLDIHIHVPEGAVPKDGPSAGITIATALISALSKRPVHRDVGMTGEITLRGRVLPIGGLREKVMAAHRAGLKTVLVPKKNEKDLIELPPRVRRDLNLVLVNRMDDVLPVALLDKAAERASQA